MVQGERKVLQCVKIHRKRKEEGIHHAKYGIDKLTRKGTKPRPAMVS